LPPPCFISLLEKAVKAFLEIQVTNKALLSRVASPDEVRSSENPLAL
jgi:hypothetical protein